MTPGALGGDLELVLEQPELERDPRRPLGRHVVHDRRSRAFPVQSPVPRAAREPVLWRPTGRPLDQGGPLTFRRKRYGALGACTGMAAAKALSCAYRSEAGGPVRRGRQLTEATALRFYSRATDLDIWTGSWPEDDTGSSGLAVAKACLEQRKLVRYEHAFGIEQVLDALQLGPVITGTWWREGLDHPDSAGRVRPTGSNRGGHEYVVNGWDGIATPDGELHMLQSWGPSWGDRGTFRMSVGDYAELLAADGDATRLVAA